MTIAAIPSPADAVWHLGPVPIRAYALCMVAGIVVACLVTEARLRSRGAPRWATLDIAVWAVPFGIVGARIYHVLSSPQAYFGEGGEPLKALRIWEGGLGIWGAVALGAVGAWLGCRQMGIPLRVFGDALAPALPLGQVVARPGNWFNNELHGGPTTLPWGLEVHRMDPDNPGQALRTPDGTPELLPGLYHPTFAYECLWNIGVVLLVLAVDRRFKLGRGRAFALYVMGYTAGRFWIEMMRTDPATEVLGMRLNVWTSVLVFLGGLIYFLRVRGPQEFLVPQGPVTNGRPAGGFRTVSEEEFRQYERTGSLPAAPATTVGVGSPGPDDGDGDDGADLVDASVPALDDFADDEADDPGDPGDEPDEAGDGGPTADAVTVAPGPGGDAKSGARPAPGVGHAAGPAEDR